MRIKMLTAVTVTALGIFFSSEASACGPVCQKGYATAGGGSSYGYGYNRYNGYDQPVVIVQRKRKVKHGDTCYAPDGSMLAFHKRDGWRVLTGPSRTNAVQVGVSCDRFNAIMPGN